ncbi:MAG: hypothetical protein V4695_09070 [Pseudomonadota bacterium]
MKIQTQSSTAFDGQQAVQLAADGGEVQTASVDAPVELTAAETAGLNRLTSASAADAMLSQQEPAAVEAFDSTLDTTAAVSGTTAAADAGNTASAASTPVAPGPTESNPTGTPQNPPPMLSDSGHSALNALVQSTAQGGVASVVSPIDTTDAGEASTAANESSASETPARRRGASRSAPQADAQSTPPDGLAAEATPVRGQSGSRQSAGSTELLPGNAIDNPTVGSDSTSELASELTSDPATLRAAVTAVSAESASVGEELISSLADNSAAPSGSSTVDAAAIIPARSDDGMNMAQLRDLGLLPQESAASTSFEWAGFEAQPEPTVTQLPSARVSTFANRAARIVEPQAATDLAIANTASQTSATDRTALTGTAGMSGAASAASFDAAESFDGAAQPSEQISEQVSKKITDQISEQIEKFNFDNLTAGLQKTSLRASDVEEISAPLSEQAIEDIAERTSDQQRIVTRNNATESADAAAILAQANKLITEELAERRRAFLAARQDSLSIIDTTQAALDTGAAAAALLQRQQTFSASADTDALSSRQSGKQTSSQDEPSSGKNTVDSATAAAADGDFSVLKSYQAPLFNRRLETNGVDDALILLIASLKDNNVGRAVEPVLLQPVTPVPLVAPREESPEERAAEAVLPELFQERRRWLRTPQLRRSYFYFDSDAFERALRSPLQQRPAMQRRRPQNPIMSDPRSTGVAERAAFWVRADVGLVGSRSSVRPSTISASSLHRALHLSEVQAHRPNPQFFLPALPVLNYLRN